MPKPRDVEKEEERRAGEFWRTQSGNFRAKNKQGEPKTFRDQQEADRWAHGPPYDDKSISKEKARREKVVGEAAAKEKERDRQTAEMRGKVDALPFKASDDLMKHLVPKDVRLSLAPKLEKKMKELTFGGARKFHDLVGRALEDSESKEMKSLQHAGYTPEGLKELHGALGDHIDERLGKIKKVQEKREKKRKPKTREEYRKAFEGRTWGDGEVEYHVGDLIHLAESTKDVEEVPFSDIEKSFEETESDEEVESRDFQERADKADLKYPVILLRQEDGSLDIMDGKHRAWKAREKGVPLKARILEWDDLEDLPQVEGEEPEKEKEEPKPKKKKPSRPELEPEGFTGEFGDFEERGPTRFASAQRVALVHRLAQDYVQINWDDGPHPTTRMVPLDSLKYIFDQPTEDGTQTVAEAIEEAVMSPMARRVAFQWAAIRPKPSAARIVHRYNESN
jgi:hypothetical protein